MLNYRQAYNGGNEKDNRFHLDNGKETITFMLLQRRSCFMKVVVFILVLSMVMPVSVDAAMPETVMPLASHYLAAYTAYICAMGGGDLEIWFEVTGTDYQEYLGVLTIYLYESTDNVNWYWVKTYMDYEYDTMLATNAYAHMDCVEYEGVAGRYYKAYVQIWGGPDDCGDTRYIWTPVERAT